jgi:hypothetical protein
MAMRNFFSHWRILLVLVAAILLAIFTFRAEPAAAAGPPLAERLRQHALGIASGAGYAQAAFARHGYRVRQQHYGSGKYSVTTLEAALSNVAPGARPERVFIVGSRYNAAHGAPDEDGAGAAAVLELAGLLRQLRPAAGTEIRFVLFAMPQNRLGADPASDPPAMGSSGNFIAFVGSRAAAGPVRQALAAFREDADFLVAGIAAPCYVQAVTLVTNASASDGALLIADTAFARYPYFSASESEEESELEGMARVVNGLARTLAALAGAPST